MGYPLVPGYETVGRITQAGAASGRRVGEAVFVPGSRGFADVRGLFGGAASTLVCAGARVTPLSGPASEQSVLLALAATAHHARGEASVAGPELIVGHGVLGRLAARLAVALGGEPTVWEREHGRRAGGEAYAVVEPAPLGGAKYQRITDFSGDAEILDTVLPCLARGGEIVLGGFYDRRVSFAFPPAFLKEARIRVAAEWLPEDLAAVSALVDDGRLSLDGLVTHRLDAADAAEAYRTAFEDISCLKMVLDWRCCQ